MQSAINELKQWQLICSQKVTKNYLGIYVMDVQKNSRFKHQLKVGDTITKVDAITLECMVFKVHC